MDQLKILNIINKHLTFENKIYYKSCNKMLDNIYLILTIDGYFLSEQEIRDRANETQKITNPKDFEHSFKKYNSSIQEFYQTINIINNITQNNNFTHRIKNIKMIVTAEFFTGQNYSSDIKPYLISLLNIKINKENKLSECQIDMIAEIWKITVAYKNFYRWLNSSISVWISDDYLDEDHIKMKFAIKPILKKWSADSGSNNDMFSIWVIWYILRLFTEYGTNYLPILYLIADYQTDLCKSSSL